MHASWRLSWQGHLKFSSSHSDSPEVEAKHSDLVMQALPPSFLTSVLANLRNDSLGVSVVQATGTSVHVCSDTLHAILCHMQNDPWPA
jgi:hypothetical protein